MQEKSLTAKLLHRFQFSDAVNKNVRSSFTGDVIVSCIVQTPFYVVFPKNWYFDLFDEHYERTPNESFLLHQSCLQSKINFVFNFLCYFHSCFFLFLGIFLIYSIFVYKSYISVSCYSFPAIYNYYFLRLLCKCLFIPFPHCLYFFALCYKLSPFTAISKKTYINFLLSEIQLSE
jgi:hypothetical protein